MNVWKLKDRKMKGDDLGILRLKGHCGEELLEVFGLKFLEFCLIYSRYATEKASNLEILIGIDKSTAPSKKNSSLSSQKEAKGQPSNTKLLKSYFFTAVTQHRKACRASLILNCKR
jgi:hypothetical protein